MQPLHTETTTVRADGMIEIRAPEFRAGEQVEVTVRPANGEAKKRSALDILAECKGGVLFKTVEEVDEYIRGERESWER